jgi:DNA-binding CsgD family transcriptional regulator
MVKEKELRDAFNKIKQEMNDHLDSINENTSEISANNNQLIHIEKMIGKLNERLDDFEVRLSELTGEKLLRARDFSNITLSSREKEVFLVLYSRTGDLLGFREISKILGHTEETIRKQIESMINKGIPIVKKYFDNNVYLILDADFRNLQAKENIISL